MATPERFPPAPGGPPFRPFSAWRTPAEASIYIERDDRLYLRLHTVQGPTVTVRARVQDPDGHVQPHEFRATSFAAGGESIFTFDLAEGLLLSVVALIATAIAERRGLSFVECGIIRGGLTGPFIIQVLFADYLTTGTSLGWPGGNITQSIEGAGAVQTRTGTNPAAGAQVSETVPADVTWSLQSFRVQLVTSAVAGARRLHFIVDDGATILYDVAAADTQGPGLARNYNVAPFGFQPAAQDNEIYVVIPPTELLFQGWRMRTTLTLGDAGDDFGAPQLAVEQWSED